MKWLILFILFSCSWAQAKGLHSFVEWKNQNIPLKQRLAGLNTLWVTTYQNSEVQNTSLYASLKKNEELETILTDRDQSPVNSTGDIVKALRDQPERQNLICVGKAAADCLEALLQYPELWPKVNYFVSLDGKISGAEYAESSKALVTTHDVQKASKLPLIKAFQFLMDALTSLWDGHNPAIHAMNPKIRQVYLRENDSKIERLSEEVYVVSLVSKKGLYWKIPYSKLQ